MNNLDMFSKEKAAKAHMDEMLKQAEGRWRLRRARQESSRKSAAFSHRRVVALAFSALVAALAALLIAENSGLLPAM